MTQGDLDASLIQTGVLSIPLKDVKPLSDLINGTVEILKEVENKDYYDKDGNNLRESDAYKKLANIINGVWEEMNNELRN